ncbi:MAG: choice-of-anchor R domain-containing protein [Solirubrobacterales bacterium]
MTIFSALVALALVGPASAGAEVLYDQTAGAATPVGDSSLPNYSPSMVGPSGSVADDFTIPADETWNIDQIEVAGAYSAPGPGQNVTVYLYADGGGFPGAVSFSQADVAATGGPNYTIPVTGAPSLTAGKYWVSVQQAGPTGGEFWSWGTSTIQTGSRAKYRTDSPFSIACPPGPWFDRMICVPGANPDQTFRLSGTVTRPEPPLSSEFTFGKPKLNKKKGSATLGVSVPNAGHLDLAGYGVKAQSADPTAAGDVGLPIKPNGRVANKLKRGGKATVSVSVTFTPTGVAPKTETTKVKLKRKRKK